MRVYIVFGKTLRVIRPGAWLQLYFFTVSQYFNVSFDGNHFVYIQRPMYSDKIFSCVAGPEYAELKHRVLLCLRCRMVHQEMGTGISKTVPLYDKATWSDHETSAVSKQNRARRRVGFAAFESLDCIPTFFSKPNYQPRVRPAFARRTCILYFWRDRKKAVLSCFFLE